MVVYWRVQYIIIKYSWTMPSLNARIAKAMPLDSQQHVSDIARYRCKKPGTLVSIIPFFFVKRPWPFFLVITALIVWSHLCESRYGSLRPFFNKMSKQFGFATGRTAMFFWFDHLFFITGKKNIITKNDHYGFFPQWPNNFVFLAFQVYTVYIYIWSTKCPSVHEFNK